MVRPGRPRAGPSSAPPQDGVFMTTQQLLDLVTNAQAAGSNPEPTHPKYGFARLCNDYTTWVGSHLKVLKLLLKSRLG